MSANIDQDKNQTEMVMVPRFPTKEMLDAAYWDANDEDAAGVWKSMIAAWLSSQQGKLRFWQRFIAALAIFQETIH